MPSSSVSSSTSTFLTTIPLVLFSSALSYHIVLLRLLKWRSRQKYGVKTGATTIAFFHPYCNAGGGGERVLWLAVQALADLHGKNKDASLHLFIYTGDLDVTAEEILSQAEGHFGVKLRQFDMPITFIFVRGRHLLEARRYPLFTMIGQSLGSMILACTCLWSFLPDIFMDTTGFAFTFPMASLLGGCRVAAYVHYPTISTDMLSLVRDQRPSYNNDSSVATSIWRSRLKLIYYYIFAGLYRLCGYFVSLVMVNSTWTKNHIQPLWRLAPEVVFPPCNSIALKDMPLTPREPVILSIGQFRPEKDHVLQIKSFAKLLQSGNFAHVKLVLLGSCRGAEDEQRVESLKQLVKEEGLEDQVEFVAGASFATLKEWLGRASVGLHTMWNEHFGICVVEYMAAGLTAVAHNSGGPKEDIVVPYEGGTTGFLASSPDEYAEALSRLFSTGKGSVSEKEKTAIRQRARASTQRFSDEVFLSRFFLLFQEFLHPSKTRIASKKGQ